MLKSRLDAFFRDARTILRILKHPRAPFAARMAAACAVGYLFSPIQLIPSFIPVIGQLDDVFVVTLGTVLLRRLVDPELLIECSARR